MVTTSDRLLTVQKSGKASAPHCSLYPWMPNRDDRSSPKKAILSRGRGAMTSLSETSSTSRARGPFSPPGSTIEWEGGLGTVADSGKPGKLTDGSRRKVSPRATFEEYCMGRWGWKKAHANRMIGASRVANALAPMGAIPDDRGKPGGQRHGADRHHPYDRMDHPAALRRNDKLVKWSGCRAKRNDDAVGGSR